MTHRSVRIRRRQVLGGWLPSLMALAAMLFAGLVEADPYPSKPVRVIVPFSPGSAGDVSARIIAQKLTESMKQSFVVELRPGANSIIGTEAAAKATPDGYTLILGSIGSHGINPSLVSKLPYDPVKDFAPIAYVGSTPYLLTVGGNSPIGSIKELVAQARAEPGKHTLGYMASFGQLVGELFKLTAKIDMTLVPYKNVSDAYVDQANGQLDGLFNSTASSLPHIKSGRVKALATTSSKRSPSMPDVPTIAESGYPEFEATGWIGFFAPAGTPKDVIDRLYREIARAVQSPEVTEKLLQNGLEANVGSPEQLSHVVKTEIAKWGRVFREAKIPKAN